MQTKGKCYEKLSDRKCNNYKSLNGDINIKLALLSRTSEVNLKVI